MAEILYGRNAVREALRAQRRTLHQLLVSSGAQETGSLGEIIKLAEQANVEVLRVDRHDLDRQLRQVNHQSVALKCSDYPYVELEECLSLAEDRNEPALLLMLDHLQDPQNIGTLLRTAEVIGVHGVIIPGRRAADVTPAVVNASAGATEHLNIAMVTNLAQTIVNLQRSGVWSVGVENDERAQDYDRVDLNIPLVLVIGAEGAGMARLTRERCDYMVRLPMRGQIDSLNAATAGSLVLYHAWRIRDRQSHLTE
ncbi:MAG: 23S rRNA (guanosine(2251)-2*-O)-methyltransferase RlmB [Chloroflexi bacterium AL-W]|nr:23S rRNA (guanosine(2251)-2*-O)-methyltransferase RlmB [Chloroflexi bacterium AL-N1]NOK70307.1 23S rRNA (guanosine(2251)-2*-O)-methyltransferase RlmB [Chloroflexi bacterium AL-N10]NOK77985.1 23S rRNA (guanosine(2251)-2*-O)-methyltransferase RlmB [Chloroflexi bacterium AL-N5]NOK85084.1 23S rRNA (guanosine(2251)-2*-O)-methyltransferase RlmB [Chloroflexi bacterium AL-W]